MQGLSEGSIGSFLIKSRPAFGLYRSGVESEGDDNWLGSIEVGREVEAWIRVEVSCRAGSDTTCVDENPDLACLEVELDVSPSILRSLATDRKALRSSSNTFTSPV